MPAVPLITPRLGKVSIDIDLNNLKKIPDELEKKAELVLEKYAFLVKELMQYYVPIDQGVAKASIYVRTKKINEQKKAYQEAQAEAQNISLRYPDHTGRTVQFANDDPDELSPRNLVALICVGVIYGMQLEYGGVNVLAENPGARRPFATPAFMHYEQQFINSMRQLFDEVTR